MTTKPYVIDQLISAKAIAARTLHEAWAAREQIRFVLPPSRLALEQRLRNRRTDSPEVIARRLRDAVTDMGHYGEFDCVVVNDDFETAVADLRRIIAAARDSGVAAAGLDPERASLRPLVGELLGKG